MNASEYQRLAVRTANKNLTNQCKKCDFSVPDTNRLIAVAALGLVGEAGEVSEHVKKYLGHGRPLDTDKLAKEMGDVLWYVAYLCDIMGLSMSEVMDTNIQKLRERWPDGFDEELPQAQGDMFDTSKESAN